MRRLIDPDTLGMQSSPRTREVYVSWREERELRQFLDEGLSLAALGVVARLKAIGEAYKMREEVEG